MRLGSAEQALLRRIAEVQPVGIRDLADWARPAFGWARPTIQTMLDRLMEKGLVEREPLGTKAFVYKTNLSAQEIDEKALRGFIDDRLGGKVSPLVAYLSGDVILSPEEIEQLKHLVQKLERGSQ